MSADTPGAAPGALPPLYTIGHEGRVQAGLIDALLASGARLLVDVRAIAASRKAGFSKTLLRGALEAQGIGYTHSRALGTPKPGRQAARAGRIGEMEAIFRDHVAAPEPMAALADLRALARAAPVCLLCFEHDARGCHRRIVADMVTAGTAQTIIHL